jgi:histidine ammonia-lyase
VVHRPGNRSSVVLTGFGLSIDELVAVARERQPVELAADVRARMAASHEVVERSLREGAQVYGLTTGVGVLKRVDVAAVAAEQSRDILRSHRVAQGPLAPHDLVRATMLRLANAYAAGTTGVRPALAERLVDALDMDEIPPVRILGSVGQADLAPMADLAAGLFGDLPLEGGEGLALVSSNAFSTAAAALATHDTTALLDAATAAGALSLEALRANLSLIHPGIGRVRPYPGLQRALARLGDLLEGSSLHEAGSARSLQDPLSFRNLPQLLGALEDALAYARSQITVELNASDSNPVVLPGEPSPVSVANYESLPVAAALDHLRLVMASILTAAGERAVKLLERPWSGLPTGLAEASHPGSPDSAETRDPGLAYLGIVVQGLVAEARLLAAPVSLEMASSSHAEGIEDRMAMAALAARRLEEQAALGRRIVAIEIVVAAQAIDLRASARLGRGASALHGLVRWLVPVYRAGEPIPDLEPLVTRLVEPLPGAASTRPVS